MTWLAFLCDWLWFFWFLAVIGWIFVIIFTSEFNFNLIDYLFYFHYHIFFIIGSKEGTVIFLNYTTPWNITLYAKRCSLFLNLRCMPNCQFEWQNPLIFPFSFTLRMLKEKKTKEILMLANDYVLLFFHVFFSSST